MACAPAEEFVTWPEVPRDSMVFLVVKGPDGVVASRGPYAMDQLGPLAQPNVLREFLREGEQMLHISFEPAAIAGLVPAFPLDRVDELRVEASAPGCAVRSLEKSRQVSLEAIGARALVFRSGRFVDEGPVPEELVIHVPIDEATCFAGPAPELTPFGDTEELLPQGALLGGRPIVLLDGRLRFVAPTGAQGLLAASSFALLAFERGQPWRDDPTHLWETSRYPSRPFVGEWVISGLVVDATRSTSEMTRILVALSWREPDSALVGVVLLELQHTSMGFSEPRVLFEADDGEFRAVFVQADGRFVAVGHQGLFVTGTVAGAPVERRMDAAIGRASLRGLAEGPGDAEPLVLLEGRRALFFGDAASPEPFRIEPVDPNASTGAEAIVRVGAPGARSYFMDADGPELSVRRPDGARSDFRPHLPADFAGCTRPVGECGELELTGDRTAMAATGHGTLVLAPGACSAALEVDPNTGCARSLRIPGELPKGIARESQIYAEVREGVLTVVGLSGRVLQARW